MTEFSETEEGKRLYRFWNMSGTTIEALIEECFKAGKESMKPILAELKAGEYQDAFFAGAHWGEQDEETIRKFREQAKKETLEEVKNWLENPELDAYEEVNKALKKEAI